MGFTGTTVQHCKDLLEQLDSAVAVVNAEEYQEAVEGLKNLQFLFCQSLARENMWTAQLQEALKLGDAAFFKATFELLDAADREGADDYFKVFGEDNDDGGI